MPYSVDSPPKFAKNKSNEEKRIASEAANRVLQRGGTEEEAIFSGIAAVSAYNKKKQNTQKAAEAPKKGLPSHLQVLIDLAKETQHQTSSEVLEDSVKNFSIRKEFLGKNALPVGVDRNLVSVELLEDSTMRFLFDTGEQILTDLSKLKTYIEQYIGISTGTDTTAPINPNSIKHYDTVLTGTDVWITFHEHKIQEIIAIYFTKNGKVVNVGWEYDTDKNLHIFSGVNLTGVKLVVHGK